MANPHLAELSCVNVASVNWPYSVYVELPTFYVMPKNARCYILGERCNKVIRETISAFGNVFCNILVAILVHH